MIKRLLLLALSATFLAAASLPPEAFAAEYSGTVYGRRSYRGYFSNNVDYQGHTVLPGYQGSSIAIPNSVNTVTELLNLLKNSYKSSDNTRKTGAAFIVNTMLQRNGGQADRTIRAADWTDLEERMRALAKKGNIDWTHNAKGWINSYKQGSHNDDAFYKAYRNEPGIVFYDEGKIVYQIIRRCANPIGDKGHGLPKPDDAWAVEDDSYIQKDNGTGTPTGNYGNEVVAKPGERFYFHHRIYNKGPNNVTQNIRTWRSFEYPGNANEHFSEASTGNGVAKNGTIRTMTGSTGIIPENAAGKQWCSQVLADPRSSSNGNTFSGEILCVKVAHNYELQPTSWFPGGNQTNNVEQGGTNLKLEYGMTNDGPSVSRGSHWKVIMFNVAKDAPAASAYDDSPDTPNEVGPCQAFEVRPGVSNCHIVLGDPSTVFQVGHTNLGTYTFAAGDAEVGSRICFVTSVHYPTEADVNTWRHSTPACALVVKKPKVQVQGGDLWVGRQFADDNSAFTPARIQTGGGNVNGRAYGSWAEYGITATGSVNGMASGAALANGAPVGQSTADAITKLTFANRPTYGNFTTTPGKIPDYITAYSGGGNAVSGTLNLTNANGQYSTANNLTLSTSGAISHGRKIVVRGNNITIRNDIAYADNYTSLKNIPQVIIIANGNLYIDEAVTRIDAWLIVKGTLYTCSRRAELTQNICNKQLTVNGPVAAKEISLRRTFGGDTTASADAAAEIFNLRPDALLKAYESAVARGRAQTVYQVELPPRY